MTCGFFKLNSIKIRLKSFLRYKFSLKFRYFAIEVLEIVAPPYSEDFISVFLPIVSNPEIFDQNISDKIPAAKEFIDHCTPLVTEARSSQS